MESVDFTAMWPLSQSFSSRESSLLRQEERGLRHANVSAPLAAKVGKSNLCNPASVLPS